MVKIPAGSYTVGSSTADDNHIATQHMNLSAFWIDKYEVTNAQYKDFLSATGRTAPASWRGGAIPAGKTAQPVMGLTWHDAAAYCTWAHKRLPGEAEWEVAGRGPAADPPLYPWGADPTDGGQAFNLPQDGTYDVGTQSFNQSPFGVYDLIGTVWQWVGQPYAPVSPGLQILRGGRYGLLEDLAYRQQVRPDDERFARVAGVRCAADRVAGE
jgi:formylglycine-generating enzyme required for sulfatase activity